VIVDDAFFDRDVCVVARELVGKVLRRRVGRRWLACAVVEAEAPGTLYLYPSRAGDSLNVSCRGEGDAVLFKAGIPVVDEMSPESSLQKMQRLCPRNDGTPRPVSRQCAGQTLLCRSLALKIRDWDKKRFDAARFYLEDTGARPEELVVTRRLGIPAGRDEHLLYRYIDAGHARSATENPLTRRAFVEGRDYLRLGPDDVDANARAGRARDAQRSASTSSR
jgi:DNA-3-methyladenine glycosylase